MSSLSARRILQLFDRLNAKLSRAGIQGEIHVIGGAVMCVAHHARPATKAIDGYFVPAETLRRFSAEIAEEEDLPTGWLNDAAKGFLSDRGTFERFLDLSHLKVFTASTRYMLALKCLAMRIGPEFQDEHDVRYLLRALNIDSYDAAIRVLEEYYPMERFPQ